MSNSKSISDSPENDFAEGSNFELNEFLMFDDWLGEDPASMVSGSLTNPVYQASEGDDPSGGSSHIGGHTSSKHFQTYNIYIHI